MSTQVNTRSIILDILLEINENGAYSDRVLGAALRKYQYLPHADRAFISRVVMGSIERRLTLDYVADNFSKVPVARMKPVIRNLIRMSIYQLVYMDKVEDFAACAEAVKLASKRGFAGLKGFVNGVLRSVARAKNSLPMPDSADIPKFFSVKYSTPEWIVNKWIEAYGADVTERILASQFCDRPLTVRCNCAKTTPDKLADSLTGHGIKVQRLSCPPDAMLIEGYDYLEKTEEFNEGLFSVQDLSSMLVGYLAVVPASAEPSPASADSSASAEPVPSAEPSPASADSSASAEPVPASAGVFVLDVCAAPGGKSLHAAELLRGSGYVEARDLTPAKTALIDDGIKRLGLRNIKTRVADARTVDENMLGRADAVLADLPCSGLGIIGRKPDIKYNASQKGCDALSALQRRILTAVSGYVKPGGVLIYSTCTLNPDENTENAEWFAENFDFEPVSLENDFVGKICPGTAKSGYAELLPGVTGMGHDGFFIAKFRKKEVER